MRFETFAWVVIALIAIKMVVALVLMYGLNGQYFGKNKSMPEALAALRANKPRTAMAVAICYGLVLVEFFFGRDP